MASGLRKNFPRVNSRFMVKGLLLTVLFYLLYLFVLTFVDESTDLWNSKAISAVLAVVLTLVSITQFLIIFYVYSLSAKISQAIREIQILKNINNDFQLESSYLSEEIQIDIESLRSALSAINIQKLDS